MNFKDLWVVLSNRIRGFSSSPWSDPRDGRKDRSWLTDEIFGRDMRSISPDFNSVPIQPGLLTPYTAFVFFAAGLLLSNFVVNTVFMKAANLSYADYFSGVARLHSLGFLGGIIWALALGFNLIASGTAGPAISYALGQGATLVAAIWGVLIWKEFSSAPKGTMPFVVLMFVGYALGLALIGMATL